MLKLKCITLNKSFQGWLMKTDRCLDKWCVGTVNGNCKRYCEGHELNYYSPEDKTETKNQSLASSLLNYVEDKNPKEKDLVEAFCRDIDSFNLAFQVFPIFIKLLVSKLMLVEA